MSPLGESTARLRIGVVGTGFGRRLMAPTFQRIGCEVVDVVSARDATAVAALCGRRLDLISVHSPPFLQAAHVGMALESGAAVHCDKPFGISTTEAELLTRGAEASGALNFLNFEFRQQPARMKMREILDAGAIGPVEHLSYTAFTSGSRVPLRPHGWLFDRDLGGGWIGAFGSHAIDAIRWLIGDIVAVTGRSRITIPMRPDRSGVLQRCTAEDAFSAWFGLETGATAALDTSFAASVALPPRMVVLGSNGVIENTADVRVSLRLADGTRESFEFVPPPGDSHVVALSAWARLIVDAIETGTQIAPSFADGLACARVMDRLRSASPVSL